MRTMENFDSKEELFMPLAILYIPNALCAHSKLQKDPLTIEVTDILECFDFLCFLPFPVCELSYLTSRLK